MVPNDKDPYVERIESDPHPTSHHPLWVTSFIPQYLRTRSPQETKVTFPMNRMLPHQEVGALACSWEFICENLESEAVPKSPLPERRKKVLVAQSCPTLCDPMNCSPPGFSVHGILQARITLERVAIPFSKGSSQPMNSGLLHCRHILYHLNHQGRGEKSQIFMPSCGKCMKQVGTQKNGIKKCQRFPGKARSHRTPLKSQWLKGSQWP